MSYKALLPLVYRQHDVELARRMSHFRWPLGAR